MKSAIERADAYTQTGAVWHTFAEPWAKQARTVAATLWASARDRYEASRRRKVAEVLYAELSKLSDADLKLRGMARGNLYQLTREMAARW
jgi:hypothetical protein